MLNNQLVTFDFNGNYILEDNNVLLRPLLENDFNNLLEFSLNEPDTWKFGVITAAGEKNLRNYIQHALDGKKEMHSYPFIVFDKITHSYAGCTRFYDIKLGFQTTQLGYTWYGERFRGTSLNKRCKFLLLQFAFEQMKLKRVEFRADILNERSVAAMKSIGCTVEGVLREDVPNLFGGRRNSVVLSILESEWYSHIKNNIEKQISNYEVR